MCDKKCIIEIFMNKNYIFKKIITWEEDKYGNIPSNFAFKLGNKIISSLYFYNLILQSNERDIYKINYSNILSDLNLKSGRK